MVYVIYVDGAIGAGGLIMHPFKIGWIMSRTPASPSGKVAEGVVSRISFREVAVDFFGSLVPGIVFILASSATLGVAVTATTLALTIGVDPRYAGLGVIAAVSQIRSSIEPFSLEILVLLVLLSYVIGHTFYRQDPKEADRRSFERLYPHKREPILRWPWTRVKGANEWKSPHVQWLVKRRRPKKLSEAEESEKKLDLDRWVADDRKSCEFPYSHLYRYLEHRGLRHLLPLAPWGRPSGGEDETTREACIARSKNFINILKIRLHFYFPDKCGAIARNEAHVRLMSSTWYMARQLTLPVLAALTITLVGIAVAIQHGMVSKRPALVALLAISALFAVGVGIAASLAVKSIEKVLHYQRVREVVWVLETAYTAFRANPEVLSDICPEFANEGKVPGAITAGRFVSG